MKKILIILFLCASFGGFYTGRYRCQMEPDINFTILFDIVDTNGNT